MVPVGGAVISSPDEGVLDAISKNYPGTMTCDLYLHLPSCRTCIRGTHNGCVYYPSLNGAEWICRIFKGKKGTLGLLSIVFFCYCLTIHR